MNKKDAYEALLPQAAALVEGESDVIARMANFAALLHREMDFWWTGFYRVIGGELVLDPLGLVFALASALAFAIYTVLIQVTGRTEGSFTVTFTLLHNPFCVYAYT